MRFLANLPGKSYLGKHSFPRSLYYKCIQTPVEMDDTNYDSDVVDYCKFREHREVERWAGGSASETFVGTIRS